MAWLPAETAGANIPLGDPDPKISHADCERVSPATQA